MNVDWTEVVAMNPHGYAEFQDQKGRTVVHGPVESVIVDEDDMVHIKLKWAAQMGLPGSPELGKWKFAPDKTEFGFPNFMVVYNVQDVPEGRRLLFAGFQIMYLETQSGLDTSEIEGFVAPAGVPAG